MMITISNAILSDAPEILRVQKAAFLGQAKIYDNYGLPPLVQTLESVEEEFGWKTVLKALEDGRIVGSVRFSREGDTVEIGRLSVDPDCQGRGIGTMLMERIEAVADTANVFRLFTGVRSLRNIHLYGKLGYTVYRQTESPEGVGLLFMEKRRR